MRLHEQPYPVLRSHFDARHPDAAAHRAVNLQLLAEVEAALARARDGGGARYVERHRSRGRLLPRERVERLLDRDAPFLELCALAGADVEAHTPGAALIGGIGRVSGVECLITANDATVKGGALSELSVVKARRLAEVAATNGLPSIALIESAGADLPNQDRLFVPGGAAFRDLARRSALKLPSIAVVFGASTAGGAYLPGLSDYAIFVKDQATVYLGGPPLVKMATGEVTTDEALGGADMHSRVSGVADYLAESELDGLRLAREVVAHLGARAAPPPPERPVEPPRYDAEELLGLVPADPRVPYDPREVIARVVDGSRFSEFKPLYGNTLVCGWAHVHGFPVGLLANHGVLFSESANKGAQFIQLCNQADVPLVFLQNVTGFMVGQRYEEGGIIKHGAKLISAVSNSTVPAITLMLGASYGAGNYAMGGRAYEPRFLFTWPMHRIAVMGGKQLAGVMDLVQRGAAAKRGEVVDEAALAGVKQLVEHQVEQQSSALYATARVWDDGIIDPRDTRTVLALSLAAACARPVEGTTRWGVTRH